MRRATRWMSALLAVLMCVTVLPVGVMAEEEMAAAEAAETPAAVIYDDAAGEETPAEVPGDGDAEPEAASGEEPPAANEHACAESLVYHEEQPTCTESGCEGYWACGVCGKLYADAMAETEIAAPVEVASTGHTWDSGTVTKAATYANAGVMSYTCQVCGETKTESIPTGRSTPPTMNLAYDTAAGIVVSWNATAGAESYRVYRKSGSGGWTVLGDVSGTYYTDTQVVAGETYTYTVRSYITQNGVLIASGYDRTGITITRLETPEMSSAANIEAGVRITWTAVDGAELYRVYRKAAGGSWTTLGDVTGTTYEDTTTESGTKYTYTVRGVYMLGSRRCAGDYDRTGISILCLGSPSIETMTSTGNGLRLTWQAVAGAEKYRVYRKTEGGNWVALGDVPATNCTDRSAQSGVTYTYTLRCYGTDNGTTVMSDCRAGKTTTYLATPELESAMYIDGVVKLSWEATTGAEQYRVYRREGSGSWAVLADVTDTAYTDETAELDSTYTYTVRAYCVRNGKTLSSDYDRTGKKVLCVNYPILTSATAAAGSITVEWNEMSGASEYYLYRKTMTSSWKRIATVDGKTLRYTDTSVTAGTAYIYTVRGKLGTKLSDYDKTGVMQMAWSNMDTVTYDSVNSSRPTYINGQMYLLTKDGHLVTDTTVTLLGSTWTVDSRGRIVGYVTDVMKTAASTLDSVGWDLRTAFNWVVKFTYYNRWMRPDAYFASKSGTEIVHSTWYAEYGLAHHYGNCLVMNATLFQFEKVRSLRSVIFDKHYAGLVGLVCILEKLRRKLIRIKDSYVLCGKIFVTDLAAYHERIETVCYAV